MHLHLLRDPARHLEGALEIIAVIWRVFLLDPCPRIASVVDIAAPGGNVGVEHIAMGDEYLPTTEIDRPERWSLRIVVATHHHHRDPGLIAHLRQHLKMGRSQIAVLLQPFLGRVAVEDDGLHPLE